MKTSGWLLLLYVLPTRRNAERVNLWRKLKKFGAVQLKTSAYVLPDDPVQYERFQWLSTEINDAGGAATLIRVAAIEGVDSKEIVEMFNHSRKADYEELVRTCREVGATKRRSGELAGELEKLQRRFNEIQEMDYFKSSAADDAQAALGRLGKLVEPKRKLTAPQRLSRERFRGKTWVTRPRPRIDRAGSAWLIRKFIDSKARFAFAPDPRAKQGAIPFDMADVEFSHHGDDCTFETLVKRFGISDKAVFLMAEMVHDADLEDGKFQRCECIGINALLSGWERGGLSDAELLAKGMESFEALYQHVRTNK